MTDTETRTLPETIEPEVFALRTVDWTTQAKALTITSDRDLPAASALLAGIKGLLAEAEAEYRPNINRWHQGHKAALADLKKIVTPLMEAEGSVKLLVKTYLDEQERIRLEAEREAREAARRAAEEQSRAEAARAKAEADRAAAEEMRLQAAIDAEEAGKAAAAEAILNNDPEPLPEPEPVVLPAPATPIPKAPPRVAGMPTQKSYSAVVDDLMAFASWAFAVGRFDEFFTVNQGMLNRAARQDKELFGIPGCKLKVETVVKSTR